MPAHVKSPTRRQAQHGNLVMQISYSQHAHIDADMLLQLRPRTLDMVPNAWGAIAAHGLHWVGTLTLHALARHRP